MPDGPTRAQLDTGDLWRWVDRLTKGTRQRVVRRPHGQPPAVEHIKVPSLWDQLTAARASDNSGGGRGKANTGSRAPLDLNIVSLLGEMTQAVARQLIALGEQPRYRPGAGRTADYGVRVLDTQAGLRQLAVALVATHDQDLVDLWIRVYRRWVTRAEEALALEDDDALDVRDVRGQPCPTCRADHVIIDRDGEDYRQPALAITFRDGQVLHVACRACSDSWWRGEGLENLGDSIRPSPASVSDER